ncbi:phage conserved hypothetical protein, phiE125 gp8 family [Polaromonas sp. OV174]|uniref:head-tail connector protein n=1 Tax=Polaromonas sp. OV174 TaxID=1855300 RepID=UPI0008F2C7FF|nr:head-tail connector protein [Polaromonas sp. OV174]SFB74212.1 phage conserved hypothetical protein, phiE125 gp8 family [Polaromonas sp. OV174]
MHKVITPVAIEPVTLQEARLHLRLIADMADLAPLPEDASITAWIVAAREFAEHYTSRALAPQTLEMALDAFPAEGLDLDMPPVASITSIKYTDAAGAEQTLSAGYALSTYGDARRVSLAHGASWPSTQDVPEAVRVRYVTGYTVTPSAARAAILLMVAHWYENRQAVSSLKAEELPMGAHDLLNTIKLWGR